MEPPAVLLFWRSLAARRSSPPRAAVTQASGTAPALFRPAAVRPPLPFLWVWASLPLAIAVRTVRRPTVLTFTSCRAMEHQAPGAAPAARTMPSPRALFATPPDPVRAAADPTVVQVTEETDTRV